MKKRVLVDMDGVLADTYHQYIHFSKKHLDKNLRIEDFYGMPEREVFEKGKGADFLYMKGFFGDAPVLDKDSIRILKEIYQKYNTFIVSSAMEFPQSLIEKYHWLAKYFPFISWENIILCGNKIAITGDYLIDDHYKNLDPFEGQGILYTQPHNINSDNNGHLRVHNWNEIADIFL